MDRINKFLNKLTRDKRERLLELIQNIYDSNTHLSGLKRIVGFKDLFRIRDGEFRIVFKKTKHGNEIVNVANRKDVYRDL